MRKLLTIVAVGLAAFGLVAGLTVWSLYAQATATVPEYEAAVAVPDDRLEEDRRAFESQLTALYSDTQSLPEWRAVVTAAQINAWLATRLPTEYPAVAKKGFEEPRVLIADDGMTLAVRGELGKVRGVLRIDIRPFVTETGELALDIRSAKIGRLTLPMEGVAAKLRAARLDRFAPVRWTQSETQTLLLVDLDRVADSDERDLRLTGVDLREGELLVRGESLPFPTETADAGESPDVAPGRRR